MQPSSHCSTANIIKDSLLAEETKQTEQEAPGEEAKILDTNPETEVAEFHDQIYQV